MDILKEPWAWGVAAVVVLIILMGGRRSGGGSMSNLSEVNAIAADTNVKLSAISAGTTGQALALQGRQAEIAAQREFAGLDLLKTGISSGNAVLLRKLQTDRDVAIAREAGYTARATENLRLKAVRNTNFTSLRLGRLAAKVRGQEIAIAPTIAAINANAATSIAAINANAATSISNTRSEFDYMARHDEARYAYKAAKAGANADMVGSLAGAATSFGW